MTAYRLDFLNDDEFQALVNDLLSERLNQPVERFKKGKDLGIDGRVSSIEGKIIIQSKHWEKSGYAKLISELKRTECQKVKKLQPDRYIFATSVGLTPKNKEEIEGVFSPYIRDQSDIYGRDDIVSLISGNRKILKNHYKLWFAGVETIELITSAAVIGRSKYTEEEIKSEIPRYVTTDFHQKTIDIIEEKKTILITGEPGVGKTTLAKNIALYYLSKGFNFIKIEENFSEIEELFNNDEKQVFYFDDFLGTNYLDAIVGRGDSRVMGFIRRVANSKEKRFILTSRTTILNRALMLSDSLSSGGIEEKGYEIRIGDLTAFEKAKMLYNHLYYSDLPVEYVREIYKQKDHYRSIIYHTGFNPRTIQLITEYTRVKRDNPSSYWSYILEKLENPEEIWRGAFENQLNEHAQWLLKAVVFNGGSIPEENLKSAFVRYSLLSGAKDRTKVRTDFGIALRLAVGSVLTRSKSFEKVEISLFNPAVGDFVIREFADDSESIIQITTLLQTRDSISNLKNLKRDELISSEEHDRIVACLVSDQRIIEIPVLKIKIGSVLTETLPKQKQLIDFIMKLIRELYDLIEDIRLSDEICRDILNILSSKQSVNFLLSDEADDDFVGKFNEILRLLIDFRIPLDDMEKIGDIITTFPTYSEEQTYDEYKDAIQEQLEDSIEEFVFENSVLDEFSDPDFLHDAISEVEQFAERLAEGYHLSVLDIDSSAVAEKCDVLSIIQENRDSQEDSNYRVDLQSPKPEESEEELIDNLFEGFSELK